VDLSALNRRVLENLIKAGAMDSLGGRRAQLLAALDSAMEAGQRAWRDRLNGQAALFAGWQDQQVEEKPLPPVPEWEPAQKLAFEKEVLGFYVTGHPLEQYVDKIRELATHTSETLEGVERGTPVAICGLLSGVQRRRSREGRPWASAQLEDLYGSVDLVVFGQYYERLSAELNEGEAVLVRGTALPEESGPPKVSVQELIPLAVASPALPSLISIRVPLAANSEGEAAEALARLFERKPGPTEVRLRLERPRDFSVILDITQKVRPDREFQQEVERICGPDALEVLAQ
jgi:DNA polymerase-3 subunit alpha